MQINFLIPTIFVGIINQIEVKSYLINDANNNKGGNMKIKLIDPECDKNFSLQFFNATEKEMINIKRFFNYSFGKYYTFLQGYDVKSGWVMIEFWTNDLDKIITYCDNAGDFFNTNVVNL